MTTCAEWEERYLEALTSGTAPAREVMEHMASCPSCQQLLDTDREIHRALMEGVRILPPPAALRSRVLSTIEDALPATRLKEVDAGRDSARKVVHLNRGSMLVARLAVAAVLLLASGLSAVNLARTSHVATATVALQVPGRPVAYGIVQVHPGSGIAYLANAKLPAPAPIDGHAAEYELWYIPNGGAPVPKGALASGPDGQWHGVVRYPVEGNGLIAITVEPAPGTMKPTSLPIAAARV